MHEQTVSQEFLSEFRQLVERRITGLILYGDADAFYEDFTRTRPGPLAAILEDAQTVEIDTVAEALPTASRD